MINGKYEPRIQPAIEALLAYHAAGSAKDDAVTHITNLVASVKIGDIVNCRRGDTKAMGKVIARAGHAFRDGTFRITYLCMILKKDGTPGEREGHAVEWFSLKEHADADHQ